MHKVWKRVLGVFLAVSLLLGQSLTALALWEGVTVLGTSYRGHQAIIGITNDIINVFQLEEGESSVMPLESFTDTRNGITYTYTPVDDKEEADFSSPVQFYMTSENGKRGKCWLLARPFGELTEEEGQEWLSTASEWLECRDRLVALLDNLEETIDDRVVELGGYHPQYQTMVYYLRNYSYWNMIGISEVPAYGKDTVLYTEETLQEAMQSQLSSKIEAYRNRILKADQTREYLACIEQWCDEIENDRIAAPDLTSFQLGDYKGIVDGTAHVTLTVPEGANLPDVSNAVIGTEGNVKSNWFAGSIEGGQLLYRLTPYASWTGTVYDGTDTYSFNTDLGKTWMVDIQHGDPVLQVQNLTVDLDGRTYSGRIDEENKKIMLTLPEGTDATELTPILTHTAATATIGGKAEGNPVDLSRSQEIVLATDTYRETYVLETTFGPSAECDILFYEIEGNKGIFNGNEITLTLPWGFDLTTAEVRTDISEDATLTTKPQKLAFDIPLTYIVTAQNGETRTYTVTLTEAEVSHANQILSFAYGSTKASIDQNAGTIVLEVTDGTDVTKLRPTIQVSEFASVYPASGEAQNFTNPVKYRVTSQSGVTNTYTVTVNMVASGENIYKSSMQSLLGNIISRYRTSASDDWEWMNLGFYERITRDVSPEALPENLNLHSRIAKLDVTSSVAMTDLDRTIMMLTALGVDATKLDQYTTEDNPFVDSKGEVVTDLVECLYNYEGGYTINGPIFALIALDMGNYTIPENAVWTRERLLETILTHEYGTDGFGVDMVGMLMQSIAPYQDDPVYGERVKAKMEEGIDLFLGNSSAPTVDKMAPDFTFGGFGYQSSESAAQALCALSAAGVDCHTDARFRDASGNSALTAFLAYADGEYFAHTMDVPKNAMATYQGCYTVQWYLGFIENGGAGHPYSLYYHQQDFSRPLSSEADILEFELEGKTGVIDGDQITVTLPKGTSLTNMNPEVTLSDYATLDAPSLPVTFSENVAQPFTVRAEDGVTTKTYYVTVKLEDGILASGSSLDPDSIELEDAKILRELEITSRTVTENDTTTDILLGVGAGVDATQLYITGTISYGASTEPENILDGTTKVNLSGWNTIKVVAEDGTSTSTYRIKVEVQESAAIESFSVTINGTVYRGVIDNEAETIKVMGVPSDADVTALAPEIEVSEETNVCSPLSGVPQNFTSTVNYTVSGKNVATRVYAVDVLDADGNHIKGSDGNSDGDQNDNNSSTSTVASAKINSFTLLGVEGVLDDSETIFTVTLPAGTDVSCVAPLVEVSSGCSVSPASGEVVDLSSPLVYTVSNGTQTRQYTVVVVLEKKISQQLWEEMEQDENNTITDHQVVKN